VEAAWESFNPSAILDMAATATFLEATDLFWNGMDVLLGI
jgi:hypothetical protein